MPIAVEWESKDHYQPVSDELLEKCGWQYSQRTDNSKFTIVVPQDVDPEKALIEGTSVFARHITVSGDEIVSKHTDLLAKYKSPNEDKEVMLTMFNSEIGHVSYVVLECI